MVILSRIAIALVFLLGIHGQCLSAEPDSTTSAERSSLSMIRHDGLAFLRGAGHVFSAPARWEGSDWAFAGGALAGTAGSALLDNDVRSLMRRNQAPVNTDLSNVTVQYGSGLNLILASVGGYVTGLAFRSDWLRETSMLTGTAILLAGTISTVMKVIIGRARPYTDLGHATFSPFNFSGDYESFPSGHTIVAFAFSGVLAERIKNPWVSVGLYTLATGTAVSRMYTDHHWLSDVVFGAIISISVSHSLVRWYEGEEEVADQNGIRMILRGSEVVFVWSF